LTLAEAAVLLTLTAFFNLFALAAAGFGLSGHRQTLFLGNLVGNVPLVTCQTLYDHDRSRRMMNEFSASAFQSPSLTVGKSA